MAVKSYSLSGSKVNKGSLFFSDSADKVVKGEGKFEQLMVCSQEIAASTTQLVVASKVSTFMVVRSKSLLFSNFYGGYLA